MPLDNAHEPESPPRDHLPHLDACQPPSHLARARVPRSRPHSEGWVSTGGACIWTCAPARRAGWWSEIRCRPGPRCTTSGCKPHPSADVVTRTVARSHPRSARAPPGLAASGRAASCGGCSERDRPGACASRAGARVRPCSRLRLASPARVPPSARASRQKFSNSSGTLTRPTARLVDPMYRTDSERPTAFRMSHRVPADSALPRQVKAGVAVLSWLGGSDLRRCHACSAAVCR